MRHSFAPLLASFVGTAVADTHYLFSGFFAGNTIVGLQFDDAASTLTLVNNISTEASSGSKWIALDALEKNLYVATTGALQSYAVTSNLSLEYQGNVTFSSNCTNVNFAIGATTSPYTVFAAPYSTGCSGLAISVSTTGELQSTIADLAYDSSAGVHGLGLSHENDFVYSADDMGNAVWAHSYDNTTGAITEVQKISAPTGANPRHLTVHPNGKWVYVIYEELNQLAVFSRDSTTGELTDTNTTYPLIPSTYSNTSSYWSDEVAVSNRSSLSPKYLITGTRSRTTSDPGYVSAFALDANTGAITSQLFLLETTGSGGSANAVTPSTFSEEYFAITDAGSNFVEVWKIADNSTSAAPVAHLDLTSGPANVQWLS